MAKTNPPQLVVRVAPIGELKFYTVHEHELDALARGSPGSALLSLAYALLPFSAAFVVAVLGTDIASDRVYNGFLLTALVTGLGGLICLALGVKGYESNTALVAAIKGRMPPPATPLDPVATP